MKLGTKKDHNVEMCILQGECFPVFFKGVKALGLRIFHAKYFVFATPPKPWGGIWMKLGTKKDHNVEISILQGECCPMFLYAHLNSGRIMRYRCRLSVSLSIRLSFSLCLCNSS